MLKTVWLIRHGESAANAGLATRSPVSIPLTETGQRQATQAAATFTVAPDLIVTSPYLRAQQTAEPTIRRFPSARVEEWPVEEFTYLSLEHLNETTGVERRPFVKEYWDRCDADYCDGPTAESFIAFIQRAKTTIDHLVQLPFRRVAVFSHGQFVRAIMWLVLTGRDKMDSIAMKEFESFLLAVPFPNAAFTIMTMSARFASIGSIQIEHLN